MFYSLNFVGMKSILKKGYSLGLLLLWIFFVVWFISIVNGSVTIVKTAPDDSEHKVVLHSLYLSGSSNEVLLWTTTGVESLGVYNWLIVSSGGNVGDVALSSVGWWDANSIVAWAFWWGIWWWYNNEIGSFYTAIGGWESNKTDWYNSVVVGWISNNAYIGWVVLWWNSNNAYTGWVVLWWRNNRTKWENSLVLWRVAQWFENSFAWNGVAHPNTARINADSGVLIWTVNPIDGVSLVVNWSIKLNKWSDITWAITMNDSWCITVYDWKNVHALGSSESACGVASWCQFGSTLLQNWDVVTGYVRPYDYSCSDSEVNVVCENWKISLPGDEINIYPYCYEISSDFGGGEISYSNICDINSDGIFDITDIVSYNFTYCRNLIMNWWEYDAHCDINWDGYLELPDLNSYINCKLNLLTY